MKYMVYLVSDSTGITAERLAQSLLTQFHDVSFDIRTLRYVDTVEKVTAACRQINESGQQAKNKPIVISTLVDGQLRAQMQQADAHILDVMGAFLTPLEEIIGQQATPSVGLTHGQGAQDTYKQRMDAVTYALLHDDGGVLSHYDRADIVLIGVSRSGKTPTSVYLAMQYGLYVANYPLVEDDLNSGELPAVLQPHHDKLFALTILPERLHNIREERRPGSTYASLAQCQHEVRQAEALFRRQRLQVCDVSRLSVEEIATRILQQLGFPSRALHP
ncbi:MAG: pyruvate, phosphate dikinase/phosphoenolpyruvate synthase regulator [Gammaproteobacteria bacterium]|nr:pyruvate, phosphate dikinase/phosphoenolpyruvate synthase regulator [Gammaproteobacteria bacterium]